MLNIVKKMCHHHCLSPLSGYRPQANILHTSLSWAFLLRATHVMPTSFISLSMHLLHVSRGLPLPLEPCGFHWRACRVILFLPFLNVCPTHFHLRLPISVFIGTCPVLSHSCSFLILSVHFSFKIFIEHLFTNTWSLFMTPCVVFQVSQPYSSTDLTFELKSLIFVEIEILDEDVYFYIIHC